MDELLTACLTCVTKPAMHKVKTQRESGRVQCSGDGCGRRVECDGEIEQTSTAIAEQAQLVVEVELEAMLLNLTWQPASRSC